MKFLETLLPGALIIEPEPQSDARGMFVRTFCAEEFAAHGLELPIAQCSSSFNRRSGTLRGMHFQSAPFEETKLVRCTAGAIHDIILDLRPTSPSFCRWTIVELSAANRRMVYIPPGIAHGFQTLMDASEVFYQISKPYAPEHARGVRWNDPIFAISWPLHDPILSDRDRSYPDFMP
ncbi:MAG TPA: dTDP-4-dehydrorhamnose 3,5-epimerase [Candidatus Binataceae bacterium]|nr:dTDP-4-dehydrorhamnose 3,5-epimerase [Candidatus Binataceae bacterium]